jgi:hypothetical protein
MVSTRRLNLREFLAGITNHPINRIGEILTGRLTAVTAVRTGHTEMAGWPDAHDIRKM